MQLRYILLNCNGFQKSVTFEKDKVTRCGIYFLILHRKPFELVIITIDIRSRSFPVLPFNLLAVRAASFCSAVLAQNIRQYLNNVRNIFC